MNDALEILDDIQGILTQGYNDFVMIDHIQQYIITKRLEFAEPKGDCCG